VIDTRNKISGTVNLGGKVYLAGGTLDYEDYVLVNLGLEGRLQLKAVRGSSRKLQATLEYNGRLLSGDLARF
jgi:hypothetical protein